MNDSKILLQRIQTYGWGRKNITAKRGKIWQTFCNKNDKNRDKTMAGVQTRF